MYVTFSKLFILAGIYKITEWKVNAKRSKSLCESARKQMQAINFSAKNLPTQKKKIPTVSALIFQDKFFSRLQKWKRYVLFLFFSASRQVHKKSVRGIRKKRRETLFLIEFR